VKLVLLFTLCNPTNQKSVNMTSRRVVEVMNSRMNIKDEKGNVELLLVQDKDSYTGSFLVLMPCMYVLQPQLVPLFQSFSLLPSPLLMVAPASLRFLWRGRGS
jgi:hypothetical protein